MEAQNNDVDKKITTLKVINKYYLELPLGILSAEMVSIIENKRETNTYVFTFGGKQIISNERDENKMRNFLSSGFNYDGNQITKEEYIDFIKALYKKH